MHRVVVSTVAALAAMLTAPVAQAEEGRGIGSATDPVGRCTFYGYTAAEGVKFAFGGGAIVAETTPALATATCTLISRPQGLPGEQPELRASASCVGESGCVVPVGVTSVWPARPVEVCLTGQTTADGTTTAIQPVCRSTPV